MKRSIFKLELNIQDTSEACIAATLERVLGEINRGYLSGFDSYVDEGSNRIEYGSYQYKINEEHVEQEEVFEEFYGEEK